MKLISFFVAVCCWACSPSIVFISSYRPPKAEPLDLKGERVAALVLMDDAASRARAEDALAREISARGAQGVAMYRMLPNAGVNSEAEARAAVEQADVKGVIAMRPRKAQKQVVTPPSTYTMPMYNGFWGGYYPYGWGTTWAAADGPYRTTHGPQQVDPYLDQTVTDPGHVDVYDVIRVEIVIFSLKQNQLVWAGETETDDPGDINDFVEDLAAGTAEELRRLWLVPS